MAVHFVRDEIGSSDILQMLLRETPMWQCSWSWLQWWWWRRVVSSPGWGWDFLLIESLLDGRSLHKMVIAWLAKLWPLLPPRRKPGWPTCASRPPSTRCPASLGGSSSPVRSITPSPSPSHTFPFSQNFPFKYFIFTSRQNITYSSEETQCAEVLRWRQLRFYWTPCRCRLSHDLKAKADQLILVWHGYDAQNYNDGIIYHHQWHISASSVFIISVPSFQKHTMHLPVTLSLCLVSIFY